jgi:hypothetical protein
MCGRCSSLTIGKVYECDFSELRHNLKILLKNEYTILKKKW